MVLNSLLESGVEVAVIEEDIWIVEPPVEMPFKGLDGLYDTIKLLIPREDYDCGVRAGTIRLGFETAYCKGLVILLTDFPVSCQYKVQMLSGKRLIAYRI